MKKGPFLKGKRPSTHQTFKKHMEALESGFGDTEKSRLVLHLKFYEGKPAGTKIMCILWRSVTIAT